MTDNDPHTARRGIAFFDLDHTLVDGDSDSSFLDFMVESGVVPPDALDEKDSIHAAYMEGRPWQDAYRVLIERIYRGREVAALEALARQHAEEHVLPMLFAGARGLVEEQRPQRHELTLLTTTNQLVVTPVAEALGLDHVLSTRLVIENGRFTGRLEGDRFCTGPEKAVALVARCAEVRVTPQECAMFGDGRSDMQALCAVGEPHAVHPNEELAGVAAQRGWPVLDLSVAGERA